MVEKKKLKFVFVFLVMIGVMHLFFHFFIFGEGFFALGSRGILGYNLIDGSVLENLKARASPIQGSSSAILLIIEWVLIIFFIVFFTILRRVENKKEVESLNIGKEKIEKSWTKTDLDNLYEVLKERKSLKLSTISKVYSVDKDIVMSWGRALETANLVRVEYPLFGEPSFIYIEKGVNGKEENS